MTRSRTVRRAAACLGILSTLALGVAGAVAADAPVPPGPVVLTRAHGDAAAVWDATTDLTAMLPSKPTAEDALRRLEADAIVLLAEKSKALQSDAKTLTVQAIYQRSGAVSPAYQTATFLGVEKLFTIKAPAAQAQSAAAGWAKELKAGKVPDGVTVTVTGKLPPELK